jgi:hypothetical protein
MMMAYQYISILYPFLSFVLIQKKQKIKDNPNGSARLSGHRHRSDPMNGNVSGYGEDQIWRLLSCSLYRYQLAGKNLRTSISDFCFTHFA